MNSVKLGDWELWIEDGSLPSIISAYLENADFVDQIDINNSEGRFYFLGISKGENKSGWPSIVTVQKYQDAHRTFHPGILLVPDTSLVFVGAGTRLLCYDMELKKRLWEEEAFFGFWGWSQSRAYVLMSAELEFGVWSQSGERLWSTFVEPPWGFEIREQIVELDVMGKIRKHRLSNGEQID